MPHTILVTGPALTPEAAGVAERRGARLVYTPNYAEPSEMAAIAARESVDAIVVRIGKVTEEVIAASPKLKAIAKHGVGYDNIDVAAAARLGVPVMIARGANAQSVAEMAFALMFSVARGLPHQDYRIKTGHWDKTTSNGLQLLGRSLGVVGFGDIGRILAGLVQPLRMTVRVFDPYMPRTADIAVAERVETLDELITASDVISLHCPLTDQTRNMIGAREFALMRPETILINTARGGLIDEAALYRALKTGGIAGAGLDTFAQEPPAANNPLLTLPNLVASPHAGANTEAARDAMGTIAVNHVMDVIEGKGVDPRVVVNAKDLRAA